MAEHLYNLVLQKNASIHASLLCCLTSQDLRLRTWLTASPPTFPFLKSQCQTASSGRFSRRIFKRTTASGPKPRSSVGAGYRFGVTPKSNAKNRIFSVFFQRLWKGPKPAKTGLFQPHIWGIGGKANPNPVAAIIRSASRPAFPVGQEGSRRGDSAWPASILTY
jgi:hypothetical protein